jgi:hypothetical protein
MARRDLGALCCRRGGRLSSIALVERDRESRRFFQLAHQKITASHLRRNAYLYIRQSTVRQVFENTERPFARLLVAHGHPVLENAQIVLKDRLAKGP